MVAAGTPCGTPACLLAQHLFARGSVTVQMMRLFEASVAKLESVQMSSGEVPLFWDNSPEFDNPKYVKTVFPSAVVAALFADAPCPRLRAITDRALDFLDKERRSDWTWSFFGAESDFPADVDDTFWSLAALRERYGLLVVAEIARQHLLRLPLENGLLPTYFDERRRGTDITVNGSVLLCLSMLGIRDRIFINLARRLLEAVRTGEYFTRTSYYTSELTLLVSISLAAMRALSAQSESVRRAMANHALDIMRKRPLAGSNSPEIFALFRILGVDFPTEVLTARALSRVAGNPSPWFRRRSKPVWYGSPAQPALYALLASCWDWRLKETEGPIP